MSKKEKKALILLFAILFVIRLFNITNAPIEIEERKSEKCGCCCEESEAAASSDEASSCCGEEKADTEE